MQLKTGDIDRYIKNRAGYHPVILIYGPDLGLVSEHTSAIIRNLLADNNDPFALLSFESDDIANDPGRLSDEGRAIALFGGERVIRIRLNGSRPIAKPVSTVLEHPFESATVIIEAGDLAKTNPVRSLVEKSKSAMAIPCYADDIGNLRALMNEELAAQDVKIAPDAVDLLLSLLGENRQTSRNELKKLALYAHGATEITARDIEELIGDASAAIADNTIDFVMTGKTGVALTNFERSLAMGIPSFQTIHALQRHLANLQILAFGVKKGMPTRDAVDKARPPIHFKRKAHVIAQLNSWREEDIIRAQDHLLTAIAESRLKPQIADTIIRALLTRLASFAARGKR